jgi:hypothetical protein
MKYTVVFVNENGMEIHQSVGENLIEGIKLVHENTEYPLAYIDSEERESVVSFERTDEGWIVRSL